MPRNGFDDDSETFGDRRALISKPPSDTFVKVALSAMVALLAFLLGFAYNGNREIGVLAAEFRQNTSATERRLTVLENRVERIWEGGRE